MRRSLYAFLLILALAATALGPRPAAAEDFGGVDFPGGVSSFADVVVEYWPADFTPGNPPLNNNWGNTTGAPDDNDASLGNGGYIVLQFTDNALTGSGDGTPDVHIFETGSTTEATDVEVSADGVAWTYVGTATGGTSSLDIDGAGFGPGNQLFYVRVTDVSADNFEDPNNGGDEDRTGADIDAVGAISTAAPALGKAIGEIHIRECPAGATDVYAECHPYGVPDVEIAIMLDGGSVYDSGMTDADGNIVFVVPSGNWAPIIDLPEGATVISVYCSYAEDLGTETYIDLDSVYLTLVDGDHVYCDVYIYIDGVVDNGSADDGGSTDDGGVSLPDTGAGSSTDVFGLLPLTLLALVAGSVAVANRRRSLR